MIDLKSLTEYARRSGSYLPLPFLSVSAECPEREAIDLTNAWLLCWDNVDADMKQILAESVGLRDAQELHGQLAAQGMVLMLSWLSSNWDVGQKLEALRRAKGAN